MVWYGVCNQPDIIYCVFHALTMVITEKSSRNTVLFYSVKLALSHLFGNISCKTLNKGYAKWLFWFSLVSYILWYEW